MPTVLVLIPNRSGPILSTVRRKYVLITSPEIANVLLFVRNASMGVDDVESGYDQILCTVVAHIRTGQMSMSVRNWVTVSIFSPFFWFSNVMETVCADESFSSAACWLIVLPFFRKTMFRNRSFFVRLCFCPGTVRYSQERMPKNNAPPANAPTALSSSDVALCSNERKTTNGRAGCRVIAGSSSVKPLSSRSITKYRRPDASMDGSATPCVRKVFAT